MTRLRSAVLVFWIAAPSALLLLPWTAFAVLPLRVLRRIVMFLEFEIAPPFAMFEEPGTPVAVAAFPVSEDRSIVRVPVL